MIYFFFLIISLGFLYPMLKLGAIQSWLGDVRLGGKKPELRVSTEEAYSIFFKSLCGLRSALFNATMDRKIVLVSVNDDEVEMTAMEGKVHARGTGGGACAVCLR